MMVSLSIISLRIFGETRVLPELKKYSNHITQVPDVSTTKFNSHMLEIYNKDLYTQKYNFQEAKLRIPSYLHIDVWKELL